MQHFLIRPYQPSDYSALIHILELNIPTYFAPEELSDFKDYLTQKIEHYFVIEWEGEIVGCGGINLTENGRIAKISWDIIHPEYQGKAMGSQLMQHRITVIKTLPSVEQVMVRTSQLAYQFYEKQGFELVSITPDYWALGFDLYVMEYKNWD